MWKRWWLGMKMTTMIMMITTIRFVNMFEIDVVEIASTGNQDHIYNVTIATKSYYCRPKSPPLSHGWAYECDHVL